MQSQTHEIRVTAKTLDGALTEAARQLEVEQEQLDYRLVSQGGTGIFSFLTKKVEISAWKKAGATGQPATSAGRCCRTRCRKAE